MLVIIDGTGEKNDNEYARSMKTSFLKELEFESPILPKIYFRGPTMLGSECSDIVQNALDWISQKLSMLPDGVRPSLYLAGYSRGGAIAIAIAQQIQKLASSPSEQYKYDRGTYLISSDSAGSFHQELYQKFARSWYQLNQNIKCMALFDAVDRAWGMDTDVIPSNVKMVYHARRSPRAGSRRSFSNTGIAHAGGSNHYQERYFFGTHAALGGIPWTGDHPTELIKFGRTAQLSSYISPANLLLMSDMLRDEGLQAAGFETPVIPGVSRSLITKEQDFDARRKVRDWMWTRMRQHGMVKTL